MAAFVRSLCHRFRHGMVRRSDLSRSIFGIARGHLIPRTPENLNLHQFKMFYFFPSIRVITVICRAKFLKLAYCVGLISLSYTSYKYQLISVEVALVLACTAIYCTIAVFATAYLCNNLIGKMYVNEGKTQIAIAFINSKGQRINKTFRSNEVQLLDHPNHIARMFMKQIACPNQEMKLNLVYKGVKMDTLTFLRIFPDSQ